MRYFEIRPCNRPTRAGKAILEFTDEVREPHRAGDIITLPVHSNVELFKLQKGWNQFLIDTDDGVWFGGTDENPFLVQMEPRLMESFLRDPSTFYEMLVPESIRRLEAILPQAKCRRQGDIYAFPIPYSWESIQKSFLVCHARNLEVTKMNDMNVFGTRHAFSGDRTTISSERALLSGLVQNLVEGKVVAPDHEDMALSSVHTLAQTAHLLDPKNAD